MSITTLKGWKSKDSTITTSIIYGTHKKLFNVAVSFEVYKFIIGYISTKIFDALFDGYVFNLFGGLGSFRVDEKDCKFSMSGNLINYGKTTYFIDTEKTRQHHKIIYDTTIDKHFHFQWIKGDFRNRSAYRIELSNNNKKKIYTNAKHKFC